MPARNFLSTDTASPAAVRPRTETTSSRQPGFAAVLNGTENDAAPSAAIDPSLARKGLPEPNRDSTTTSFSDETSRFNTSKRSFASPLSRTNASGPAARTHSFGDGSSLKATSWSLPPNGVVLPFAATPVVDFTEGSMRTSPDSAISKSWRMPSTSMKHVWSPPNEQTRWRRSPGTYGTRTRPGPPKSTTRSPKPSDMLTQNVLRKAWMDTLTPDFPSLEAERPSYITDSYESVGELSDPRSSSSKSAFSTKAASSMAAGIFHRKMIENPSSGFSIRRNSDTSSTPRERRISS